MEQSRALLLIADIGGYTKYMRLHRLSLAHAQVNTARLLEAVVDAAPGLELIEIEGDAALLSSADPADDQTAARTATKAAIAMHRAFHSEQERLITSNMCFCDGCRQAGQLKFKCVAHVGDVAAQKVRDRTSLVGPDVIFVHRLLKNDVPLPEYVLLSEELYGGVEADLRDRARPIEQNLEGLGKARAYFVGLGGGGDSSAREPAGLPERIAGTISVLGRGMPYLLGLKRAHAAVD